MREKGKTDRQRGRMSHAQRRRDHRCRRRRRPGKTEAETETKRQQKETAGRSERESTRTMEMERETVRARKTENGQRDSDCTEGGTPKGTDSWPRVERVGAGPAPPTYRPALAKSLPLLGLSLLPCKMGELIAPCTPACEIAEAWGGVSAQGS